MIPQKILHKLLPLLIAALGGMLVFLIIQPNAGLPAYWLQDAGAGPALLLAAGALWGQASNRPKWAAWSATLLLLLLTVTAVAALFSQPFPLPLSWPALLALAVTAVSTRRAAHSLSRSPRPAVAGWIVFGIGLAILVAHLFSLDQLYGLPWLNVGGPILAVSLLLLGLLQLNPVGVPVAEDAGVYRTAALLLVLVTVAAGATGFQILTQTVTREARAQLLLDSRSLAEHLTEVINHTTMQLLWTARQPEVIAAIQALEANPSAASHLGSTRLLPDAPLAGLGVLAPNQTLLAVRGRLLSPAHPIQLATGQGSIFWQGQLYYRNTVAVQHDGALIAHLVAETPLTWPTITLLDGAPAASVILCASGTTAAAACFHAQTGALTDSMWFSGSDRALALSVPPGVVRRLGNQQHPFLTAHLRVGNTGLGLLVMQDAQMLYVPLRHAAQVILASMLGLILVGLWGLHQLLRPILRRLRSEGVVIRHSEGKLKRMVENLASGAIWCSGEEIYFNRAVEAVTGYSRQELPTLAAWFAALHGEDATLARRKYETARAAGFPDVQEFLIRRKDGLVRHIVYSAWREADGEVWLLHDATSQRQAEEGLRQSETVFRTIFEQSGTGLGLVDMTGRFIQVNSALSDILGYSMEELCQMTWLDVTYPEDLADDLEYRERAIGGEFRQYAREKRYIHRDGHLVWVLLSMALVRNEQGEPAYYIAQIKDITDRKGWETSLRESEERLRLITNHLPALISFVDRDLVIRFANREYERWYNRPLDEIVGRTMRELVGEEAFSRLDRQISGVLAGVTQEFEMDLRDTNVGRVIKAEYAPQLSESGEVTGYYVLGVDYTARRQAEEALFHEKELAETTLDAIGDAVITTDHEGRVNYFNTAATKLLNWREEVVLGQVINQLVKLIDDSSRQPVPCPVMQVLNENRPLPIPENALMVAGEQLIYAVEGTAAPIPAPDKSLAGVVLVLRDVTEPRQMARQISWAATHDSLTGLANRAEFERLATVLIEDSRLNGHEHALVYMDLDQFKVVNDTCGHLAGDELLKQLANLLRVRLAEGDTLARLGGDEFGILLANNTAGQAARFVESLLADLAAFRFNWGQRSFVVVASCGISPIHATTLDFRIAMSQADAACYTAKDLGRNRVQVFEENDADIRQRHQEMDWVSRINRALEEGRFCLYRQKIVSVAHPEAAPSHYEVLLRMIDEDGRLIMPGAFIPAAERYSLMPALDRWVVETLFSLLSRRGWPLAQFAINVSGTSLNDERFLQFLLEQFERHGTPPGAICIEITETAAIASLARTAEFMHSLKDIGCLFALDDFGCGLSSFAYLRNLPVDFLKIDGSFVRNMVNDPVDRAMVESIHHMGRIMGIQTVAEFVESDGVLQALHAIGIDFAQGYCVHRPEPIDSAISLAPVASPASETSRLGL